MPTLRQAKLSQKTSFGYGYGLLLVLFSLIVTLVFWWRLPPQVPLFYSLPYGVSQLATKEWFFILPGLSTLTWLGYLILSKQSVKSGIYIQLMKWLFLLSLFLLAIAIIHVLFLVL